jgi:hypothetical protein
MVWVAPSMTCTPPPPTTYTRFSYVFTALAPAEPMETITKWGLDCGIVRRAIVYHPSNLPPVCNGPSLTRFAPKIPYIYPQNTSKTSGFRTTASATFLPDHRESRPCPAPWSCGFARTGTCASGAADGLSAYWARGAAVAPPRWWLALPTAGCAPRRTERTRHRVHGARHRRTPRGSLAR